MLRHITNRLHDSVGSTSVILAGFQVGDLAITCTVSGENTFPLLCMRRRFRGSPPSTLPYHTLVRPGVATLDHIRYWSDYSRTEVDLVGCGFSAHSLEARDELPDPPTPWWPYQSWTAKLDLCVDDMWADFDGDAELTALDWVEFVSLFDPTDRRADVNADRRHDLIDAERVAAALRR